MAAVFNSQPNIQSVSISKRGLPSDAAAPIIHSAALAKPTFWLGAKSPFGLALPDAAPAPETMYAPRGVWLDEQRLIVCDSSNRRILIWNQVPSEDQTPADIVLGQPNFQSEGPAAHGRGPENGLHLPTGVIVAEDKLIVADAWHHRILVWNTIPSRDDMPPDYAVGQLDRSEVQPNRGGPVAADSFRWPHDFAACNGELFVADAGNHHVLSWPKHPSSDGPADIVLGQKDFDIAYELPYHTRVHNA